MPDLLSTDGKNVWPTLGNPSSGQTRFAIIALGIVVAIVMMMNGTNPTLTVGQIAVPSMTLQVGDTYP